MNICQLPPASYARQSPNNGIHQVVLAFEQALQDEYTFQDKPMGADLIISHAGAVTDAAREFAPLLAVCHGLYPTAEPAFVNDRLALQANRRVTDDLIVARESIVPSQWVAEILRRDAKLNPHVLHWGVHLSEWQPNTLQNGNYVLWNKNREDQVCNPRAMQELARRLPAVRFKTTFGQMTPNVEVIGRQPHERMVNLVKRASVYLATTKETGDIGTREALAAGVPVVGFRQGAIVDVVQNGVNGVLVEPGDFDALALAVRYAIDYREILSQNALELSQAYSWESVYPEIRLAVENALLKPHYAKEISVIIPCYNYGALLEETVKSVVAQTLNVPTEILIINDGSTDDSHLIGQRLAQTYPAVRYIRQDNTGVAGARNRGLQEAYGRYIVPLDADDRLAPGFLAACYEGMIQSVTNGIAYTRLRLLSGGMTDWLSQPFNYESQLAGNNQIPTCCMYRREDALRVGGYRKDMQPSEDADFFTRLLTYTGKTAIKVSEEPLFLYNLHEGSLSSPYRVSGKLDPYRARGLPTWGKRRPFIAPVPDGRISNPVYSYDNPLIHVIMVGEANLQARLDDLDAQSMWQWSFSLPAPFVFRFGEAARIPPDFFEQAIEANLRPDKGQINEVVDAMCCGKVIKKGGSKPMNSSDFIVCRVKTNHAGRITIKSPTRQVIPETGQIIVYRVREGDQLPVHRADVTAMPGTFIPLASAEPAAVAPHDIQRASPLPPPPRLAESLFPPKAPEPVIDEAILSHLNAQEKRTQIQNEELRAQSALLRAKEEAGLRTTASLRTPFYDLDQCADLLNISHAKLKRLVKEKKLEAHSMKGKLRIWNPDRLKQELGL